MSFSVSYSLGALEEALAGRQLEQHDAGGEDVAPPVDRLAPGLLGRHVRDLALELPALASPRRSRASLLAMPKSTIFTSPVNVTTMFCGEMSRWTMFSGAAVEVALLVRVGEAGAHAEHDRERVLERELGDALLPHLPHDRAKVLAVHVLHRDEVSAVDLPDVEDLDDVRVRERGRDARLVEEHVDERAGPGSSPAGSA